MIFCLIFFLSLSAHATQSQSHQEGRTFGKTLIDQVKDAAKSTNPTQIPGFQTDKPKEATLTAASLGDAAVAASQTDDVAKHITSQAKDRQTFKIDPDTDPLFLAADQAIANPQKTLEDEITEGSEEGVVTEEIKICEESGEEYSVNCSKRLEIALRITPERGHHNPKYCPGHRKFKTFGFKIHHCNPPCRGGEYVIDQPRRVDVVREQWVDECAVPESLVEQGLCRYVSQSRSRQNETRSIQGEPVKRDHFEEHYQYACFKTSPKSCVGLREKGCYQIQSVCKERNGSQCILWEQTYRCTSKKQPQKTYQSSNKTNPFCLTGNCADTSYEANGEMLTVMSQMSVLREAQGDLKQFQAIFKGQDRRCARNCLDFRDCCGNGKGWGVSLGLSSCSGEEKELRARRDKNQCVMVGTYCAEKFLGQCIRKKTTFCCYGSKIARLIQENARAQLRLGWGTPESPGCNGLSPEQLSQVDFSNISFSELFEDIKNQIITKGQGQVLREMSTKRLQDNMTLLTKPTFNPSAAQELKKKGL